MKTNILTLTLLLLSAASFAQTKLIDEFPAMMKARNADVVTFFQARSTPDLIFITGHDGIMQNKDWLITLLTNNKNQTAEITNLKIQQSGDLAVATGISSLTAASTDGSKTSTYKDAFTYTLRWLNNRWMFTNLHHTKIEYK